MKCRYLERVLHALFALSEVSVQRVLVGGGQCLSVLFALASLLESWLSCLQTRTESSRAQLFQRLPPSKSKYADKSISYLELLGEKEVETTR